MAAFPKFAFVRLAFFLLIFLQSSPTASAAVQFNPLSSWPSNPRQDVTYIQITGKGILHAAIGTSLYIANVSTAASLTNATFSANLDVGCQIDKIQVIGTTAYLSCGVNGLKLVDVSNPASPVLLASLLEGLDVRSVGSYPFEPIIFVACGDAGIFAISIWDPQIPEILVNLPTAGPALDMVVFGRGSNDYAFVAEGDAGAVILDVTDFYNPVSISTLKGVGKVVKVGGGPYFYHFFSDAQECFKAYLLDSPMTLSAESTPAPFVPNRVAMDSWSSRWYIFAKERGTYAEVGSAQLGDLTFGATKTGATAASSWSSAKAVAETDVGIHLFNNLGTAKSYLKHDASSSIVRLAGDRLYVGDGIGGLQVLKLDASSNFVRVGGDPSMDVRTFSIFGSNVFAAGQTNLKILNFSNPSAPTILNDPTAMVMRSGVSLVTDSILVTGTRAFIGARDPQMTVLNLANPASPTRFLGSGSVSDTPFNNLELVGTYLFSAGGGLLCMSVNSDSQVSFFKRLSTPGAGEGLKIRGNRAYLADHASGLQIFDISSPSAMKLIATFDTPGDARAVDLLDSYAFVADGPAGVTVVDISDETNPLAVATIPSPRQAIDVQAGNGRVYIANGYGGVTAWEMVTLKAQTISLSVVDEAMVLDDPFPISATASSGLPVTIQVEGPAFFSEGLIHVVNLGDVTVTASQPGNAEYASALVQKSFPVRGLEDSVAQWILKRKPSASPAELTLLADPDRDGVPNVHEFLLGSDLLSADSSQAKMSASLVENNGIRYLRATFPKPRSSWFPARVEVADFSNPKNLLWSSYTPNFGSDGVGVFLWPVANGKFPIIRFSVKYP